MNISVQEIREKLIPLLCSLKVSGGRFKKVECQGCARVVQEIQEWLDTLLAIEQSRRGDLYKINLGNKDWTK